MPPELHPQNRRAERHDDQIPHTRRNAGGWTDPKLPEEMREQPPYVLSGGPGPRLAVLLV
eukprot:4114148-Prymnesium_polylepis.1